MNPVHRGDRIGRTVAESTAFACLVFGPLDPNSSIEGPEMGDAFGTVVATDTRCSIRAGDQVICTGGCTGTINRGTVNSKKWAGAKAPARRTEWINSEKGC